MTYVDITITPASGYTYVHTGQFYDQIASTLAAHPAWEYVEYVDAISGASTYRRHIWRCKSAQSGLPADFYVMFQTQSTTATGLYSTTQPVHLLLAEGYSGGVLSKMASAHASITPASDLTNPATWTLTTYTSPASVFFNNPYVVFGSTSSVTSARLLYIVAKDGIMTNWGGGNSSITATSLAAPTYVGAYDTILGANDPMPLVMFAYQGTSTYPSGGCTRAPLQTPGVAVTEVFSTTHSASPVNGSGSVGLSNESRNNASGQLGTPSNTQWVKSDGGYRTYRGFLSSFTTNTSTNSSKGMTRGYPKYMRVAGSVATHSAGDTFLIDGKVHLGLGGTSSYGFWDTEAV